MPTIADITGKHAIIVV